MPLRRCRRCQTRWAASGDLCGVCRDAAQSLLRTDDPAMTALIGAVPLAPPRVIHVDGYEFEVVWPRD